MPTNMTRHVSDLRIYLLAWLTCLLRYDLHEEVVQDVWLPYMA